MATELRVRVNAQLTSRHAKLILRLLNLTNSKEECETV